jgi:hypothetical protein
LAESLHPLVAKEKGKLLLAGQMPHLNLHPLVAKKKGKFLLAGQMPRLNLHPLVAKENAKFLLAGQMRQVPRLDLHSVQIPAKGVNICSSDIGIAEMSCLKALWQLTPNSQLHALQRELAVFHPRP